MQGGDDQRSGGRRTRRAGTHGGVHIEEAFALDELETARAIVRAHPFATIVGADLRATHMPCLVDEDADGLVLSATWRRPTRPAPRSTARCC